MDDVCMRLYDELVEITKELLPYYDIDKVKYHSVYIWTKDDEFGANVFDITADEIFMYDEEHIIIKESVPIITKIQQKIKEIENYLNS